jgi:tRNA A-37 threonylcarbamoyl transferase component Bud32
MTMTATCAVCGRPLYAAGGCPGCDTRLAGAHDDVTRLAAGEPEAPSPPISGGFRTPTSSSGWLSSSGAIDHGRFAPGALLGGRYRVVGRLGRGGMGDVYRADDLKLGQPVALKFLPEEVDRDPARLTQLHTEVRMARQVSHPNVCRVYDIDEVEGHTFLSMEYVDGEDLASILRRFGRFPEERALEIARQTCAGLAAAHERGVVHRDFKPANVMLDGAGKVRITDFGLAGVAGETVRAGTPAYMAPEQLAGGEVTARSDIYALGLVLYEIFTGQRALDAKNLAELIRMREQAEIVPPSAHVRDLSPQIEPAIMRCLSPAPADRPASALAVAASLPGGDPLAAALAAGETPSPEMVAAAGGSEATSRRTELLAGAWIVLSLLLLMFLYDRVMFVNRVSMPKAPAALQDRAIEALGKLGYTGPHAAEAWGVGFSFDYAGHIERTSDAPDRWDRLATERPDAFVAWHRTSPQPLIPIGETLPVSGSNPPLNVGGMTRTIVDASGRLTAFAAVPPSVEDGTPAAEVDWHVLFEAAGLPMERFAEVEPRRVPPVHASERRAWEGRVPESPDFPLRVEAAAFGGRPVYFTVTGPWAIAAAGPAARQRSALSAVSSVLVALLIPALMLAGAVLARHNVKLGRGDRRGAFRAAATVFVLLMLAWLLRGHVSPVSVEINRMFASMGVALFGAGVLWVTYLGLEPYVRRYSPESMIGWTRLIAGRWRDPRVGYDVLIGVAAGLAMTLFYAVHNVIPPLMGQPEPMPLILGDARLLLGTREVLGYAFDRLANGIYAGMLCMVGIVALRLLLKRAWLTGIAAILLFTPVAIDGMFPEGTPVLDILIGLALMTVFVVTILRVGLLATVTAITTHFLLLRAPVTTDFSAWHAPAGLWLVGIVAALGLGACYIARHGMVEAVPAPRGPAYVRL